MAKKAVTDKSDPIKKAAPTGKKGTNFGSYGKSKKAK
jgi:hypothetical protein